ncbi:MAG: BspA family leucine-rich repeat surface protein [Prevotella sp.]|nr:BspA family leucine-rich repeat surface protein [Prevotella sp.]
MRNLNTEDVMVMSSMFRGCSNLKSLDLSNFNTDYVLEMYSMFEGCSALTTLDISTFTGEFVFNMNKMFFGCTSLTTINLGEFVPCTGRYYSSFSTLSGNQMCWVFQDCTNLRTIYCNENWSARCNAFDANMFYGCEKLVGAISYTSSKTDSHYANPSTGYFTYKIDTFGVKINEMFVTNLNYKNLTVIPGVTGKASYDNKTKTLYLENASIAEMTMAGGLAMENSIDSLTINVTGDCSISSAAGIGIKNISKTLIITGTGTLDITAGNNGIVMTNTNPNNLVIDGNVTVNVTADNYGVQGREYIQRVGLIGTTKTYYRTTLKVCGENSKLSVNGAAKCFQTLGGFTAAEGYKVTAPSRTAFYGTFEGVAYNTFCRLSLSFGKELSDPTTTLTPVAGTAVVIEKPEVAPVIVKKGDVNGDNTITMADANAVVNYYLAATKPEDFDVTAADVNGDDDITMADANQIVNMFLNGDNDSQTTETPDTKQAIDLGLSVKWATCNVGASEPWDYGDYFAWGETTGYAAGTTHVFNWSSYKYRTNSFITKYVFSWVDNTVYNDYPVLLPEDDAAVVNWGGTWRMPTEEELKDLWTKCQWTWQPAGNTKYNGVAGYEVTGTNGNSIFIPHAGYYDGEKKDNWTILWSSTLYPANDDSAWILWFSSGTPSCDNYADRYLGVSVRPVCP